MTLGSNVPSGQSKQLMSEVAPELWLLSLDMLEVWRSALKCMHYTLCPCHVPCQRSPA